MRQAEGTIDAGEESWGACACCRRGTGQEGRGRPLWAARSRAAVGAGYLHLRWRIPEAGGCAFSQPPGWGSGINLSEADKKMQCVPSPPPASFPAPTLLAFPNPALPGCCPSLVYWAVKMVKSILQSCLSDVSKIRPQSSSPTRTQGPLVSFLPHLTPKSPPHNTAPASPCGLRTFCPFTPPAQAGPFVKGPSSAFRCPPLGLHTPPSQ